MKFLKRIFGTSKEIAPKPSGPSADFMQALLNAQNEAKDWQNEAKFWRTKYFELEKKEPQVIIEATETKKIKTELSKAQQKIYDLYEKLKKDPKKACTSKEIAKIMKSDLNATRVKIDRIQKKLEAAGKEKMQFDND